MESIVHLTARGWHPRRVKCFAAGEMGWINIGGGDSIKIPKKPSGMRPRVDLTKQQAVQLQLKALQDNNTPYVDHGVEVLYRFAKIDPFKRSNYFGFMTDLGQFERFRRIVHDPRFSLLLNFTDVELLSSLQISELEWKQRVRVHQKYKFNESAIYSFTVSQELGGLYDSYYFTKCLLRE